ncbi:hypothetical protein DOY81_011277 [Sarcophaga bullata]|nr:hypothetical protein DOY81_011277 [Sarcophaga bullata]
MAVYRVRTLTDALKGADKQQQLLGNVAEILVLHEREILH